MAAISVTDFSLFINQQIQAQERAESYLWQLEALVTVATMTHGFYDLPEKTLHNYFLTAGNLVDEVSKANQISLNDLLKHKAR